MAERDTTYEFLSGSTHGSLIKVAATSTPGTLIHTAINSTTSFDEVYLWVTNTHTSDVTLTLEWAGTTDPDNLIVQGVTVPASSWRLALIRGEPLRNALVVRAFAGTANHLLIGGWVHRTTVT